MAHECEFCWLVCYCDCDDLGGLPQPSNCKHLSGPEMCEGAREEFGPWDDEDERAGEGSKHLDK